MRLSNKVFCNSAFQPLQCIANRTISFYSIGELVGSVRMFDFDRFKMAAATKWRVRYFREPRHVGIKWKNLSIYYTLRQGYLFYLFLCISGTKRPYKDTNKCRGAILLINKTISIQIQRQTMTGQCNRVSNFNILSKFNFPRKLLLYS